MHNLAKYYDYELSIMHKDDDKDFYNKYKDHKPIIRHFKD